MKRRPAASVQPDPEAKPLLQSLELARCHPLVAETARYMERVATELQLRERDALRGQSWVYRRGSFYVDLNLHGRVDTHGEGRLRIVATLRSAEWILSLHEKLLRALENLGCAIEVRPYRKKHVAVAVANGAQLPFWFSEDFDKKEEKEPGQSVRTRYVAKDAYQVRAEPLSSHQTKVWRGDQKKLDDQIDEIAQALLGLLADEAKVNQQREIDRQRREAHAEEMKIWWAEQDLKRKRKEARRAQVDRLLQAASGHDEYLWATKRLAEIEAAAPDDEALRVWVAAVRENLNDPHEALIKSIRAEAAKEEKPLWWPEPPSS